MLSRRCPCALILQWKRPFWFSKTTQDGINILPFPSCLSGQEAHPEDKSDGLQHSRISRILENGSFGPPANWKQMLEAESDDRRETPVTKAVSHQCRENFVASHWFWRRCNYAFQAVKRRGSIAEELQLACTLRGQSRTSVSDRRAGCSRITVHPASVSQTRRFKDGSDESQAGNMYLSGAKMLSVMSARVQKKANRL
jgi:hypothetical protein